VLATIAALDLLAAPAGDRSRFGWRVAAAIPVLAVGWLGGILDAAPLLGLLVLLVRAQTVLGEGALGHEPSPANLASG
jgi:hypothetical protein